MIGGLVLLVYGGRHPTTALFTMTLMLVSSILIIWVAEGVLPEVTPWWTIFYVLYFALGCGSVLAIGAFLSPRVGVLVCCAALGLFVGYIVDIAVIRHLSSSDQIAMLITIPTSVAISMFLSIPLYEHMVIIASSIFGSYLTVRVSFSSLISLGFFATCGRLSI
jgi:hypothetical protein